MQFCNASLLKYFLNYFMEILVEIFNSPDSSFWGKFGSQIVSFIGILISAGIAIYLFNKGLQKERNRFQTNREIEKQDKKDQWAKEIQGLKDHILVLLESVIKAIDNQIEEYLTKCFYILNHPYQRLIIDSYTHENLKRILSIDAHRIWKVFGHYALENKHYYNFYTCLDYFHKVIQKVHEDVYEGNGQTTTDLMNDLIKIRNKILTTATNYLYAEKNRNSAYTENKLWVMINTTVLDYYHDNDGNPDIYRDYILLVNKFKTELLKEEFKYHPISDAILKHCKRGGDTYISITQINKVLAQDIIKVSEKIQDMNIKLAEIYDLLKGLKNNNNS